MKYSFFFLLYQPMLGRGSKRLVKLAFECGWRHVKHIHQFLDCFSLGISAQYFDFKVIVYSEYGREQSSQLFFSIKSA